VFRFHGIVRWVLRLMVVLTHSVCWTNLQVNQLVEDLYYKRNYIFVSPNLSALILTYEERFRWIRQTHILWVKGKLGSY